MRQEDLLNQIAETAYNVGFGAKKHFATYDMIEKLPGIINFIAITVGVLSLFIDSYTFKSISALLVIIGVIGVYISSYSESKNEYSNVGSDTTQLFNSLKELYFTTKSKQDTDDFRIDKETLKSIESEFYSKAISKQVLFSDWYAHYKFFWQWRKHINWMEKQLSLTFWLDKVPLSFIVFVIFILVSIFYLLTNNYCCIELIQNISVSQ